MKRLSFLVAALLAAFTLNAAALGIGDPAPALKISKWVKGDAITGLESNKTYVVEFWATWCGPCRVSIPHLTQLAHQYTNVTFIGVDVFEHGDDIDATVAAFVQKMGDKMDYHVGRDTADQFMAENWMKAAEQGGIPTAFLIQSGKILWIGHPMALEQPLADATSGHFDLEKTKKRTAAMERVKAFFAKAMKNADDPELVPEGKELESLDKELGGILPDDRPFNAQEMIKQARFQSTMQDYEKAVLNGADDAEIAKLEDSARAAAPDGVDFAAIKKQLRDSASRNQEAKKVGELFDQYTAAVGENGDKDKAAQLSQQIQGLHLKDPQLLNELAWSILTDEKIKQRDLPLATSLAKASVDASDSKEPAMLDTYARALFDSGKISDALENQKKAVALCDDATMKTDLQATLDKYQAAANKTK